MTEEFTPAVRAPRVPTRLNRELARVEHSALVSAHKVQAVNFVGHAALGAVSQLSLTQNELEKLSPAAALRLAAITDAAVASIQTIVLRMGLDL